MPVITAALDVLEWRALGGYDADPLSFAGAMGLFFMSYTSIALSLWPYIVPPHCTNWQTSSAESTQTFLPIGTLFLLPVILMYTTWSYWVFRGKIRDGIGYH